MSSSPSPSKNNKSAYLERERMKNYESGVNRFNEGGRHLQSQQMDKSYTKLDTIHYAVILSILLSIVVFSTFLILTYIPFTKGVVMKLIDTLLVQ